MIVVLVQSRRQGKTGWVNVRGSAVIRFSGCGDGDKFSIEYWGGPLDGTKRVVDGDCTLPLEESVKFVRVDHIEISGNPVDVDLLRR